MTQTTTRPDPTVAPDPPARRGSARSPDALLRVMAALAALALVALAVFALSRTDGDEGERSDVGVQGDSDTALHEDAASLVRRADGLHAEIDMPTPAPGSYEYPTSDLVPPWAAPHPPVNPGASAAPEAFTGWLFVFNHPERCTDGVCDLDDVGTDTAALGGSYQFDGRIASDDRLVLSGPIRLGQDPASGARLEDPIGAEVHLAVAPHGRAFVGPDGWRQLNGPVGNPTFWWAASFVP
ncbi:hypothetical protein [Ilumatobacter sp.]|uniref:hypothetical protein n=1 Tax=Ilumatobacter sp. TaxID=1967498 RepID=UPI003AF709C6